MFARPVTALFCIPALAGLALWGQSPAPQPEQGSEQTINEKKIEAMPLGDRRSMNMVGITGASVFVGHESGGKASFSLGGGRSQSQGFLVDGGNAQGVRMGGGQMEYDLPVEALQEVKVMVNGYSAEYGGSAGGVVSARMKGGSNRFRGSLYEYLRNDKVDAANFFAPISGTEKIKAPLRYNVFGGTLGGPLRRDQTFFFFTYEGSRRLEGNTRTLTVPTLGQRAGDFAGAVNAQGRPILIYDPATTRLQGTRYVRDPFPNNAIPTARFDPVAARLIPFYPEPNLFNGAATGGNNFTANSGKQFVRDHVTAKVDHNLTGRDRLSGRFVFDKNDQSVRSIFPNPAAENQTGTSGSSHQAFASWARAFRPELLSLFRVTYSHRHSNQLSQGLGDGWPTQLGLRGVPDNAFPRFQANGYSPLGPSVQERRQSPIEQWQISEALTWRRGNHSWRIGAELRPQKVVETDLSTVSGQFVFSPQPTGLPGQANTGNGFATLLLGFPTNFTERMTQPLARKSRYLGAYIQDDWKAAARLTLNLGLRWEADTPLRDANNRISGFDTTAINPVSSTPGVVRFGGIDGWPEQPYRADWNNIGPRLGLAWRPFANRAAVVRAGYGIFFAQPFDRSVTAAASLGYELSARLVSPDNGITAPFYLRNGVPISTAPPELKDGFGAAAPGQLPFTAVTFFEANRRSGYAQQYNFSIEQELRGGLVASAGLVGNLGRKLAGANLSMNQIPTALLGPGASQANRPFPQFSDVQILAPPLGISSYHAGVFRLERRFAQGLQLLTTYTWSKFLNNVDEGGGGGLGGDAGYANYYDRTGDYGPSDNDIRHRLTWSAVWEAPFGPGHRLLPSGFWSRVAGGWAVGSIATLQSGPPFTVTAQTNTLNAFAPGPLRADVLFDPNLPRDQRSLTQWFNLAAFAQPAPYTFGNQGVNVARADGLVSFDFSILRTFQLREGMRLQFRGELFNAFNHPNFGIPGKSLGSPDFGLIDSAAPGRRVQFGLRLIL